MTNFILGICVYNQKNRKELGCKIAFPHDKQKLFETVNK